MKHLIFLFLLFFGLCFFVSCRISVKGENGATYHSYEECCAALDFTAAHVYLEKMKGKMKYVDKVTSTDKEINKQWEEENKLYSAREYVFRHEALFLMSQNREDYKDRIIYLLKEGGTNDSFIPEIISMLIGLAIENDDELFVKRLANQYINTKNVKDEQLKIVWEYLYSKPSADNKGYLISLLTKMERRTLLIELAAKNNDVDYIIQNQDAVNISNAEIIAVLSQLKNKQISDIIIGALLLEKRFIPTRPSIGRVNTGYSYSSGQWKEKSEKYIESVKSFNNKCLRVLSIAISSNNLYLAQKARYSFMDNIVYQPWDNPRDSHYWFVVSIDKSDINDATSTLNEAIRQGTFK